MVGCVFCLMILFRFVRYLVCIFKEFRQCSYGGFVGISDDEFMDFLLGGINFGDLSILFNYQLIYDFIKYCGSFRNC